MLSAAEVRHHLSMSDTRRQPTDDPGRRVIDQRLRNRVIEYLELASSFEQQRDYAKNVPMVNVPYEVINQWEDWVPAAPVRTADQLGVYSDPEVAAMMKFQAAWEQAADGLPDTYPSISEAQRLPVWLNLREEAECALAAVSYTHLTLPTSDLV